jgi:hypothetical protein
MPLKTGDGLEGFAMSYSLRYWLHFEKIAFYISVPEWYFMITNNARVIRGRGENVRQTWKVHKHFSAIRCI